MIIVYIGTLVTLYIFLILALNRYHTKIIIENFSEQAKFSQLLLEETEISKGKDEDTDTYEREQPPVIIDGCDCPSTEFTTFKADYIESDKTSKVTFRDDVKMKDLNITDTLSIDSIPFMRYDKADAKIIIG
jgi:hypothetical protein